MKVLLDTHVLLWYYLDAPKLSATARSTINDPANRILVSPASHWEIAIKLSTGKYALQVSFPVFVQDSIFGNGFSILPIDPRHTAEVLTLPYHHRDPFDRMLVAQAIVEGVPIVSNDSMLDQYPIRRVW